MPAKLGHRPDPEAEDDAPSLCPECGAGPDEPHELRV